MCRSHWLSILFVLSFLSVTPCFSLGGEVANVSFQRDTVSSDKYQLRAVWLTTNYGLDWPNSVAVNAQSEAKQQKELITLLDNLESIGVNTIFLQVRSRGRLIYPSVLEPLSTDLVALGSTYRLSYDPLKFAIQESHKRGIAVHAWIVVLPYGNDKEVRSLPEDSYPKAHSAEMIHYNGHWFMDPHRPSTINHLRALVRELLVKYPVSGIHLDYIRYPDRTSNFPDGGAFAKSKSDDLAIWRRRNINNIVVAVRSEMQAYSEASSYSPLLSTAVLGRYKQPMEQKKGMWTAFDSVYQDPIDWASQGAVDFIVPMMYFRGGAFPYFLNQWQCYVSGVNKKCGIVVGLAPYMVDEKEGGWARDEVPKQMAYIDSLTVSLDSDTDRILKGVALFRAEHTIGSRYGVSSLIKSEWAKTNKLPWRGDIKRKLYPQQGLLIEACSEGLGISWVAEGESSLYSLYLTFDGSEPTGDDVPYLTTTDTKVIIPWDKLGSEALVGCRVGIYDLVTCDEIIPIESGWYYYHSNTE